MEYKSTIAQSATLSGKGLHTGKEVHLTFHPADADYGIRFVRTDLAARPEIRAHISHVHDTSRGTSLCKNGVEIKTLEHLMASLAGLGIDNLQVEIDADELPILDGSARFYVECFQKVGLQQQNKVREYIEIGKAINYANADLGADLTVVPSDHCTIEVNVNYDTHVLSQQKAVLNNLSDFYPEVYNCRTFVFLHELYFLMKQNLIKGGDVNNAIVFVDKIPDSETLDKLAKFFNKSDIQVMPNGTLNNVQLHYENEPARHKLLDLIGDLYLLGKPIRGKVVASKPGHLVNTEFAKIIAAGL
ncbi:MAG: UDP-3-O-acyl-N-acetylglucosamine deacetylase [Bacteroidales bacterium]|jgi:UDP-3-O-[3-hydroxymyristoyl] N-acetylglucosamine deacetylase/3-hydroxyacyl-[acyl-carrier-protein] dehydratase|nr:UDP-3-O-acyl-N-acetylglucosamine deacetylase [Bacteroidales bacterium]